MAFTTVPGANGAADSFLGTSGVDIITLNAIARPVFLGARQANDSVSFNSDNAGALNAYTLNGGDGADTFTSLSSTNLNRSRVLGDAGDDAFILTGLISSTASGGQGRITLSTLISVHQCARETKCGRISQTVPAISRLGISTLIQDSNAGGQDLPV